MITHRADSDKGDSPFLWSEFEFMSLRTPHTYKERGLQIMFTLNNASTAPLLEMLKGFFDPWTKMSWTHELRLNKCSLRAKIIICIISGFICVITRWYFWGENFNFGGLRKGLMFLQFGLHWSGWSSVSLCISPSSFSWPAFATRWQSATRTPHWCSWRRSSVPTRR